MHNSILHQHKIWDQHRALRYLLYLQGHYNEKCDVFSFGILVWAMLSEERPFAGKDLTFFFNPMLNIHGMYKNL